MCDCSRRFVLKAGGFALIGCEHVLAEELPLGAFMREAFRMRDLAVKAGDQPYGAVLVRAGAIIGYGPSRVVQDQDANRHAERVAIAEAQAATASFDLSGSLLVSTSIPCRDCQDVAARANVERMIHGRDLADAGAPRRLARR